ncbi:MAG: hypothetical protein DRH76_11270, partial [Deltaproteobacteria bacterium]
LAQTGQQSGAANRASAERMAMGRQNVNLSGQRSKAQSDALALQSREAIAADDNRIAENRLVNETLKTNFDSPAAARLFMGSMTGVLKGQSPHQLMAGNDFGKILTLHGQARDEYKKRWNFLPEKWQDSEELWLNKRMKELVGERLPKKDK